MKKKNIIIIIITCILAVLLVGISFAFFRSVTKVDKELVIGSLEIDYVEGDVDEVNINNLYPIDEEEKLTKGAIFKFNIINNNDYTVYYDIKLGDLEIPTALTDLYLKWELYENKELINNGNFLEISNTKNYLKRSIEILAKEEKEYELLIWLESNSENQNYTQNRSMSAKIEIEGRTERIETIKDEITVISNSTNGTVQDLKIYGNTVDGVSVGEDGKINLVIQQNLIYNGLGELGNNNNFEAFNYNDEKYQSVGSFYLEGNNYREGTSSAYISINYDESYYLNTCVKNNGTNATYYSGIKEYDIDKLLIGAFGNGYGPNTLTYLTQDLNDGDMVVYLNDVSNFRDENNSWYPGFIFWNYEDSRGVVYPELTYSRNTWSSLYAYDNINKENNTITLNSAWNHGTIKAGVKVSQLFTSGGTYNYTIYNGRTMTTEWQCFNRTITGVLTSHEFSSTRFRRYTTYLQWLALNNYNSTPDTETYYSRIIIRKDENIENITIDMTGYEPLRSNGEVRDYIDYKNKRIVRLIDSDGSVKEKEEYESIELPEIKTYDGNTIVESSDKISPIFQVRY